MMFALGTGAPIFVLFPLLIYGSKARSALTSRVRRLKRLITLRFTERNTPAVIALPNAVGRSHRIPSVFSEWEGSVGYSEFKRGLHWRHRFVFAVLLWMSFVSFISADFAMQAAPVPGIACFLTESNEWILKADPNLLCFSSEMRRSHLAGALLALVFTMAFPSVIYSKLNRISNLQLWDNADCQFQMGYFYGPLKTAWCYLSVINHLQLCVFMTVFNLIFWQDEMAMTIVPMTLDALYVAVIVVVRPYASRLDNILEAIFYTICAFGFGLSLLQMHDPENTLIEVRIARKAITPNACRARAHVVCSLHCMCVCGRTCARPRGARVCTCVRMCMHVHACVLLSLEV
jgi:hypothetical protein